ncbi:MAG TPA: DUF1499 domain-containing protein [Leptolyngbyaceae cyanobacterium M33_DOE_097]|uniref:DUF1499 domain-containing protein n=1 Tax=Oscillatoriales cyanobacterium SpSt-418 TaxID=2282169 RepID=A0A7C3PTF0_9CYAN|nr:DUF1499 domain-containing protein [Leptolyngbyaceae cyanobacterium M33_DOE_097]
MTGTCSVLLRQCFLFVLVGAIALVSFASPVFALSPSTSPMIAAIFRFSGKRPTNLGLQSNGGLLACPNSPNCVSSYSTDTEHAIAPLAPTDSLEATFQKLKALLETKSNVKLITATDDYLYAEFTSALMGFVDDVEFYLDPTAGVIQVRSASRLGESDLGVNRKRIEAIRTELANA